MQCLSLLREVVDADVRTKGAMIIGDGNVFMIGSRESASSLSACEAKS